MRTTIDLPDPLYRTLKARAALSGTTLRELIQRLLEQGLQQPEPGRGPVSYRRAPPPVIIAESGVAIPAVSRETLARLEEEEDDTRHARSARR